MRPVAAATVGREHDAQAVPDARHEVLERVGRRALALAVLAGVAFGRSMTWLKENHRSWQPAAVAAFAFGLLLPLSEMIRLHPYEYAHFNHIAGTVRTADNLFMLDYWGLALKQASDGLREELTERQEAPPQGRKWKVAVCGPQRPAQVALGPDFTIGWDSHSADFAMTLGEFYCKGLTAPVLVEIKRDDVVFARVYDIRGRAISTLLRTAPKCFRIRAATVRERSGQVTSETVAALSLTPGVRPRTSVG